MNAHIQEAILCRELNILDKDGRIRIVLATDSRNGDPRIDLLGPDGRARVHISLSSQDDPLNVIGRCSILRKDGDLAVGMGADEHASSLSFHSGGRDRVLSLEIGVDGVPRLNGKPIADQS